MDYQEYNARMTAIENELDNPDTTYERRVQLWAEIDKLEAWADREGL